MMLCSPLHLCQRSDPTTCWLVTFSIFTHLPVYTSVMCFFDSADKNYVHLAPKTARGRPNGKQRRCQRFAAASAPPSCLSSWKVWKCFSGVELVETKRLTPSRLEKYVRSGAHLNQNRGRCPILLLICPPLSLLCVSFSLRLPIFISHSFFSFLSSSPPHFISFVCSLYAPPVSRYYNPSLSIQPAPSFSLVSSTKKMVKNIWNMLRFCVSLVVNVNVSVAISECQSLSRYGFSSVNTARRSDLGSADLLLSISVAKRFTFSQER